MMPDKKCSTFQPCNLREKCALDNIPESQVRQHFYPSDVGDSCKHYQPIFRPYGNAPDGETND
jgi:hypothetical protein